MKALYPSLDVDFTVDKVREVFYGSQVRVEGVNAEELGLYLSVSLKEDCLFKIACLPTKQLGVHMNSFKRVRTFQIELEFRSVDF